MKWNIIYLNEVGSTNAYLLDKMNRGDAVAPLVVCAFYQAQGRGQRGTVWHSEPGKNLTASIGLRLAFLPVERQFSFSQVCALATRDLISRLISTDIPVKIKWPNDIFVSGKKIAGILIENTISGNSLETSVAGFGVNINQTVFDHSIPNPVSARVLTGKTFDIKECLEILLDRFSYRYSCLVKPDYDGLMEEYNSALHRVGTPGEFLYRGVKMTLTIRGVSRSGELLLVRENGMEITAAMKELVYL